MLRAVKVDTENEQKSSFLGKRKTSQDLEHVNICIEKTFAETNHRSVSNLHDSTSSKDKRAEKKLSPMKMNSKLVPHGLEPKKSKNYQKMKNSRTSGMSSQKPGPDSALIAN
jgi:hypothetical protein